MSGRAREVRPGVSCAYSRPGNAWLFFIDVVGTEPAARLIRASGGVVYYEPRDRRVESLRGFQGRRGGRAESAWALEIAANKVAQLRERALNRIHALEVRLNRAEAVAALLGRLGKLESIRYLICARVATFAPKYAEIMAASDLVERK